MKKSCPTKISGFTLIELLVTISIMGILFGLGVAKYNEFNRRQILEQAAQELKSNLRLVQDKALAGEKDCTVCMRGIVCGDGDDRVLDGWYVSFSTGSYQIYGSCGGLQFPISPQTVNLSSRNISIPSPPSPIRFKPLAQGVDGATTISLSGYGETRSIMITVTGEIK